MSQAINPEDFVIKMMKLDFKTMKTDPVFCQDFIKVLGKIMVLE